jgi:hypothetical protein
MSFNERSASEARPMAEFDYGALAELFPTQAAPASIVRVQAISQGRSSHPFRDGRDAAHVSYGRVSRSQ